MRAWYDRLADPLTGPGAITAAKCYRLLRAILNTAVRDGEVRTHPCVLVGAGDEHSGPRPAVALDDVLRIAAAVPDRRRAFVPVAASGGLRIGELDALTCDHWTLTGAPSTSWPPPATYQAGAGTWAHPSPGLASASSACLRWPPTACAVTSRVMPSRTRRARLHRAQRRGGPREHLRDQGLASHAARPRPEPSALPTTFAASPRLSPRSPGRRPRN